MVVDMESPEMQKMKRENYPEYRKIYRNQKMKILNGTVTSVRMEKIIQ